MGKFKAGQHVCYTRNKATETAKIVYVTMYGVLFLDNGQRIKQEIACLV